MIRALLLTLCLTSPAHAVSVPTYRRMTWTGEPSRYWTAEDFCGPEARLQYGYWADWDIRAMNLPEFDRYGWTGRYRFFARADKEVVIRYCETLKRYVVIGVTGRGKHDGMVK